VINCSVGASSCEAWTPAEVLTADQSLPQLAALAPKDYCDWNTYEAFRKGTYDRYSWKDPGVKAECRAWARPEFDASSAIEGDRIRVRFTHGGGGLEVRGKELKGFAIAASDKKFVWARAAIEGESVVVWSETVKAPRFVRYAWADNPECNLYNRDGLPASPFRTDDF